MTVLSDELMSIGHFDVYEASYEDIVRRLGKAGMIPQGWTPGTPLLPDTGSMGASPIHQYEFKWGSEAQEVHGSYSAADMTVWKDSGYFDQETKPWIRQSGTGSDFVEYTGSMTFTP